MRVFRGITHPPAGPLNVTIGNFDGMHVGHMAMLQHLKNIAHDNGLPTAVLTFEPHPREFFTPDNAPPRLSNLRDKLTYFQDIGIDYVWILPFNHPLARMSAENFADLLLVKVLNVKHVLIGDDFCFGYKRLGNINTLKAAGTQYQFAVTSLNSIEKNGLRISSTAIRQALQEGEIEKANAMLGRPYHISGKVIHGNKLGRTLGYPTANIQLRHTPSPLSGIFCVEIHGLEKTYQGVASLGIRPTLTSPSLLTLEVYIFDFDKMIYGQRLSIDFFHKLRDEAKFSDLTSLVTQIAEDVEQTRRFFQSEKESLKLMY